MLIPEVILDVLACPVTKNSLCIISDEVLLKVNDSILKKKCRNVKGDQIKHPLRAALYEPHQKRIYPIIEGIPILIEKESILFA